MYGLERLPQIPGQPELQSEKLVFSKEQQQKVNVKLHNLIPHIL